MAFVVLSHPTRGISGRFRNQGFVWVRRNDRQFIRLHVPPEDPKSPFQIIHRQRWGAAKRNWSTGPDAVQREQWQQWALRHLLPLGFSRGDNNAGYNAFQRVELMRIALSMPPGTAPPSQGLPGRILQVEQMPADAANTFAFRLHHDHHNLAGALVLVETTPPTLRQTRAPREGDLRWAAGPGAESFLPLQSSGTVYQLRDAQYAVEPGQRYGIRIRIVSAEAVAGNTISADWIRIAFSTGSETGQVTVFNHLTEKTALLSGVVTRAVSPDARRVSQLNQRQTRQLKALLQSQLMLYGTQCHPPWMKT